MFSDDELELIEELVQKHMDMRATERWEFILCDSILKQIDERLNG